MDPQDTDQSLWEARATTSPYPLYQLGFSFDHLQVARGFTEVLYRNSFSVRGPAQLQRCQVPKAPCSLHHTSCPVISTRGTRYPQLPQGHVDRWVAPANPASCLANWRQIHVPKTNEAPHERVLNHYFYSRMLKLCNSTFNPRQQHKENGR